MEGKLAALSVRFDWRRRTPLAWIVMACSVLLTVLAWDVSRRSVSGRLHDQFMLRTEQLASTIVQRMDQHESVLRGGVALFLASKDVTRDEFRLYFQHLELERFFPGIQGIGFAELVPAAALDTTIERVRNEGFSDFTVHPAGARTVYTPIIYIEPFNDQNLRAFGFDMYSEAKRRDAMQRAWRTGRTSMSSIVRLIQNASHDDAPGCLLYLPVFRSLQTSPSLQETYPIGFVYSPLRIADLMGGILGHGPTDLDYTINEPGSPPFFTSRPVGLERADPALTRDRRIELGGRPWNVHFESRKNFGNLVSRYEPSSVLLAGLVINVLLFCILSASASLRRRAEALAGEMTQELSLSHAREQEQMLRSL
ncbi:MAG: hypothetical protein RLZZ450_5468, partial [Pseudomonadota bacterium]